MKPILRLLGFLTLFSLAQVASAQITFTITATADADGEGYTSGQPYTFIFTLGNFTNLSESWSVEDHTFYREETTDDDQLWASVGGSGLGGSFVRPTGASDDPWSLLQTLSPAYTGIENNNGIALHAGTDQNGTLTVGLTTLSNTSLYAITAFLVDDALPTWPMNQGNPTTITPYNYFSAYVGNTYFTSGNDENAHVGLYYVENLNGAPDFTFTITSLTIGSAVPEPSTYAALFGVAALGVAVWRRRKRAA